MQDLIKRSESLVLIVEFYPHVLASRGLEPRLLLDTLSGLGFEPHVIGETTGELVSLTSWKSHKFFISSVHKLVNLFAIKGKVKL